MSHSSSPSSSDPTLAAPPRSPWSIWLPVALGAFVLYALTANRGAQWQDSGEHIWRIVTGELINVRGLALSHPLHYWLGRIAIAAGRIEPCFAVTLVSAIAAAFAVANVVGCVSALTNRSAPALFAACSLAIAHTYWQMATVTETYTLTAALLAGECWALVDFTRSRRTRSLALMFLLNGLGVANHMLAILTTPVLVAVAIIAHRQNRIAPRRFVLAATLWLIGSTPYSVLVLLRFTQSGDLADTMHSALFGDAYAGAVLNFVPSARHLVICAAFAALNFPNLLLPTALVGIARARAHGANALALRALAIGLVIHTIFVIRYDIVDQHTFLIPTYVLLAIFGGVGFAALTEACEPRRARVMSVAAVALLAITPVMYAFTPGIARRFNALRGVERHKPYRDDYVYLFTPWSIADDSAERMARQAVELAGNDGLILVEDGMAAPAIRYVAWRTPPDERIIARSAEPGMFERALSESRSVVLVPLNVDEPGVEPPVGSWKRNGDLYVLAASD